MRSCAKRNFCTRSKLTCSRTQSSWATEPAICKSCWDEWALAHRIYTDHWHLSSCVSLCGWESLQWELSTVATQLPSEEGLIPSQFDNRFPGIRARHRTAAIHKQTCAVPHLRIDFSSKIQNLEDTAEEASRRSALPPTPDVHSRLQLWGFLYLTASAGVEIWRIVEGLRARDGYGSDRVSASSIRALGIVEDRPLVAVGIRRLELPQGDWTKIQTDWRSLWMERVRVESNYPSASRHSFNK